jgi:hypothetical protein
MQPPVLRNQNEPSSKLSLTIGPQAAPAAPVIAHETHAAFAALPVNESHDCGDAPWEKQACTSPWIWVAEHAPFEMDGACHFGEKEETSAGQDTLASLVATGPASAPPLLPPPPLPTGVIYAPIGSTDMTRPIRSGATDACPPVLTLLVVRAFVAAKRMEPHRIDASRAACAGRAVRRHV